MFDKLKDLGGLMQQAQAMQQKVQELQAELERLEIVGSSGAGLVKVTVNGKNETRKVEIDASLLKPDDKGVVEDLVVAACNDARTHVEDLVQEKMKSITGGLPLPPATAPLLGSFHDQLVRTDQGWRFAERRGSLDFRMTI